VDLRLPGSCRSCPVVVLGQPGAEVDVRPPHPPQAAALHDQGPEGEVRAVHDHVRDVAGLEGDGRVQALALELDAVALVGADEPVGRVGRGVRAADVAERPRRRLHAEALLRVVRDGVLDLGK
jgi:hypothetical protein